MQMNRFDYYLLQVKNLGLENSLRLHIAKAFTKSGQPAEARSKHLKHPVSFRTGTSDLHVFHQIFVEREYACLDDLKDVGLILDLGANVGFSSAYFLSKFPDSFVVAVEPDPANFVALEHNLKPYEGRYKLVRAAVWPENTKLYFDITTLGQQAEWGRKVGTAPLSNIEVEGIDINSLLNMTPYPRISLLKMDIEGAEREVFSRNIQPWLSLTDAFAIEVHGAECEQMLQTAISGCNFSQSRSGELTIGIKSPTR